MVVWEMGHGKWGMGNAESHKIECCMPLPNTPALQYSNTPVSFMYLAGFFAKC